MKTILCLAILAMLVAPAKSLADPTNAITNIAPAPTQNSVTTFQAGSHIILPDGQKTYIETILPNGYFITANGLTVSAKGIVLEGPDTGEPITVDPDFIVSGGNVNNSSSYTNNSYTLNRSVELPGAANRQAFSPNVSNNSVSNRTSVSSNARISTAPTPFSMPPVTSSNASRKNVVSKTENVEIVQPQTTARQVVPGSTVVVTRSGNTQSPLTLAQLLPLTDIKTGKNLNVQEQAKTAPGKAQENPAKMAKNQGANAQKKPDQPTAAGQGGKNQGQGKSGGPGQPLRIPPEAIASGNTDFMKGCWQGTRPEYATKRTIKECFCFNDDGKIGKRRIYDDNRMCIGSAKADLSQNGVLSVTSGGGVCDDGATWSAAEMVCQNSGQKTPCSWIFTDINNARQSYQIPFVRVESCGK